MFIRSIITQLKNYLIPPPQKLGRWSSTINNKYTGYDCAYEFRPTSS